MSVTVLVSGELLVNKVNTVFSLREPTVLQRNCSKHISAMTGLSRVPWVVPTLGWGEGWVMGNKA